MPNLNSIDLLIFLSFLPSSTLLVHVVCYRTVKDSLTPHFTFCVSMGKFVEKKLLWQISRLRTNKTRNYNKPL